MFKKLPEEKFQLGILLSVLFVIFFIFSWLSQGTHGGGDDYTHYQIAHYAFKYPIKFLYHWGKPFYTLLIAPFAQFGFFGSKFFNLLIGFLTAYFSYRLVKQLGFSNPLLAPFFVLFTPIYLVLVLSGMTEILFSFLLVFSAYLFFSNRPVLSALVLSFLPFVRTEGVIILPIFAFAFLLYKNYRALPFLFCAYIAYSIVGYFAYGDINWVINQMPYGDSSSIYGSGSLWHFVARTKSINGLPLGLLFIIGLLYLTYGTIRNKISTNSLEFKILLIVAAPAVVYYAAHSYVWWQGKGASFGLIRVMAGISPLMAIIGLYGLNHSVTAITLKPLIQRVIAYAALILIIITPFRVYQIPVPLYEREKLVKASVDWLKKSEYYNFRILYFDPLICHFGEIDPFDNNRCAILKGDAFEESVKFQGNDIMIWDAGFGPAEGRLSKERLLKSPNIQLIKHFVSEHPIQAYGGKDFEIMVFIPKEIELTEEEKKSILSKIGSDAIYKLIHHEPFNSLVDSTQYKNQFEHALKLDTEKEFVLSYSIPYNLIYAGIGKKLSVKASAKVLVPAGLSQENLALCMSLNMGEKTISFNSIETKNLQLKPGEWHTIEHEMYLNQLPKDNMTLTVFFWNFHKNEYYIDDYTIFAIYRE